MSTCSESFGNSIPIPAKAFQYLSVSSVSPLEVVTPAEQRPPEAQPQAPAEPSITEQDVAAAFERGRQEGRRQAEHQASEQLAQVKSAERARISKAIDEFQQSNSEYFSNVEAQVVHLAMGIAGKILHREAQVDPMLIAALVKVATENLKQGSHVQVNVRPEEVDSWRHYFEQDGNGRIKVDLVEDPTLGPGDCVLHSDVGTAELGISAQLKEIEHGLFDLLAQRPKNG